MFNYKHAESDFERASKILCAPETRVAVFGKVF